MFRAGQRISETSWPITPRTGIGQVYHVHHFWAISNSHLTFISQRYLSHLVFGVPQPSDLVCHYTTATEKQNRDISSKHATKSLKMTPGFPHTRPGKLSQKTMEHHHAFFMDKSTISMGHFLCCKLCLFTRPGKSETMIPRKIMASAGTSLRTGFPVRL